MLEYIESYLGSTLTPGQAGNQLWALVYIFIIFAGISVAVMAMNWLERKALAHMQVRWARCELVRMACCSRSPTP